MSFTQRFTSLLTQRGQATLNWLRGWGKLLRFTAEALVHTLSPATYNSATRSVVQKQIFFTAWQILPGFSLFAAVLSFVLIKIVVETARDFGLSEYALEMSVRVLVIEVLPLVTALFVALRSGAAINTEVALMNINREIDALRASGVDPMRFEFIPRVIGGTLSVVSLAAVSWAIALFLAYVVTYGFQFWSLGDFNQIVGKILTLPTLVLLWLKVLLFGLAVTVIPISEGLAAPRMMFFAPIAVLRGMVRLFFVIMLIEVSALALKYI